MQRRRCIVLQIPPWFQGVVLILEAVPEPVGIAPQETEPQDTENKSEETEPGPPPGAPHDVSIYSVCCLLQSGLFHVLHLKVMFQSFFAYQYTNSFVMSHMKQTKRRKI
jgi:hypothetical protein